jgi:energy-converting hydrogenase Eha subunit G
MIQSHVIDISGVFAGAAVKTSGVFRFVAVDPRLEDLDQSEWPSLSEIRRVATHVIHTGQLPSHPTALAKAARPQAALGA